MPFVTDIVPPSAEIEAAAALALAMGGRKRKGFPGKRKYENIELLGCFTLTLQTVSWEKGAESGSCLIVDPQGLLTGSLKFDLPPAGPPVEVDENLSEDDFIALCQKVTREAADYKADLLALPGLITAPGQARSLLKEGTEEIMPAAFETAASAAEVAAALRERMEGYAGAAAAWAELKHRFFTLRDRLAAKINSHAAETRAAADRSLAELEQQVKAAVAARKAEIAALQEEARQEHLNQKTMLQSELERFHTAFKESGEAYWREKIKEEEERIAAIDKKLAEELARLNEAAEKYAASQEEQIDSLKSEVEKRLAAFEQRLKRLDTTLAGLEKGVEMRLKRYGEQQQKIAALAINLPASQCDAHLVVPFYAARYSGGRWQVFAPQQLGHRGLKGKLAGLFNLPFRPSGSVGEELAGKIETLLPGHVLEENLAEMNLLEDPAFLSKARAGLARLIEQKQLHKKFTNLFEGLDPTNSA
ncbi:MAG: hypothetical protein GX044_04425 [Firmicutes bacterium]|jgi:hypothetical protein|nr:hypothetical protein [Bacillota bacterium]